MPPDLRATMDDAVRAFVHRDYAGCFDRLAALMRYAATDQMLQMAIICLTRLDQRDELADLGEQALAATHSDPWTHALLAMSLGRIEPAEIIRRAAPDQRAKALCYAGLRLASDGLLAEATLALRSCVELGERGLEQLLAECELQALSAASPAADATPGQPKTDPAVQELVRLRAAALEHQAAGRQAEAVATQRQACELAQHTFGISPELAVMLNSLGEILRMGGDFVAALPCYEQAIELWGRLGGDDEPRQATVLNNLGLALTALHRFDGARTALEHAIALDARRYGADHPEVAVDRHNLGELFEAMDRTDLASAEYGAAAHIFAGAGMAAPFSRSLARAVRLLYDVGEHAAVADLLDRAGPALAEAASADVAPDHLDSLGWVASHVGRYEQSERLHRRALAIREAAEPGGPSGAVSLNALASCLQQRGEFRTAEELYQRALAVTEAHPASPARKDTLNNLAGLLRITGRFDEAVGLFETLVAEHPSDGAELGKQLNNLGNVKMAQGALADAAGLFERALQLRRDHLELRHPDVAETLLNLGHLHGLRGEHAAAVGALEEALAILDASVGNDHPRYSSVLVNLAVAHMNRGELPAAEALCRRAGALIQQRQGKEHPDLAMVIGNLAVVHGQMGDLPRAALFHRQAIEMKTRCFGADHPSVRTSQFNLAGVYLGMGRVADARELAERLVERASEAANRSSSDLGRALSLLAAIQHNLGELDEAGRTYRRAIDEKRRCLGPRHPSVATSLNNLAELEVERARFTDAEAAYREALGIAEMSESIATVITYITNLSWLLARTGRPSEGFETVLRACRLEDDDVMQVLAITSERQRLDRLAMMRARMQIALAMVARWFPSDPTAVGSALELVLRRKSVSIEIAARQGAAAMGDARPELRPLLTRLADIRARASALALHGDLRDLPMPPESSFVIDLPEAGQPMLTDAQRACAVLDQEREQLEAALARAAPELLREPFRCTVAEVASSLPADSALVEIVLAGAVDGSASRYLAFVLRAGAPAEPRLVELGTAANIDALIAAFRRSLVTALPARDVAGSDEAGDDIDDRAPGRLADAVLAPLRLHLAGVESILIAPDGELACVPFEALPGRDGGYLVDEMRISYLSVGRELLAVGRPPTPVAMTPAVVVADPDYDLGVAPAVPEPTTATTPVLRELIARGTRFTALPGAAIEGREVADLLGVGAWLGAEACEGRVKACRSPRILHLATHAFFLERLASDPERAAAAGGEFERHSWLEVPPADPLLRAGLVLAGANSALAGLPTPADAEDGVLTADDVLAMELHGTQLVVLSACETGLGHVTSGEGVFGLRRAFAVAGARSLLLSLWKVPDDDTRELMVVFYRHLLAGMARVEALRAAQRVIRARRPQPFYWAAFVCQGDPGPMPG